jgi:hypothetical protein
MGVVLRELANPHDAVQRTVRLVPWQTPIPTSGSAGRDSW